MTNTLVTRFFGGSPLPALVRLALISLIVGALLMWLDIEPFAIFEAARQLFDHLWGMGFDAVRQLGRYLLAGAIVVVPIWLVARLFNMRGAR